ncbi:XTP/dITP diphosphatase [Desulfosporosinus hippei]|uniref:dITP/XTP pyrophosphatase n=1 Tax=Desulfosporosinus hippei DSM 8344 TaxID=1121419 RepID=A0A1G8F1Y1_9FIRM|nr:XTP/dITP diphosphatase [Desulfosporosinus hippei]SDH76138.1 XTP/dITP diphosphohydrolase [Desulfosporosinus hippei DSM 8344]
MKIILATQNKGKIRELQELLGDEDIEVLSLKDIEDWEDVEENGITFADNAALKAKAAVKKTGLVALADDSGLEVDALAGNPGVYSARFAGEPKDDERNNDKLLQELKEVADSQRQARFRCALVIATPDGKEFLTEGTVEGQILAERRGKDGFGYDPLFFVPEYQRTMAELTLSEKNRLSHRAQAFRKAIPILQTLKGKS